MADGVAITAGSGTTIATDDLGATGHAQWMKLLDGTNGGTDAIPGSGARGLTVDPRHKVVRLSVTPTISTSAYAAKDAVGGLMTFSNAARSSGGSATLLSVQVADKAQQMKDLDLVLFDRTFTAPTDNAIFAPTDAESLNIVACIPITAGSYFDFSTNSIADVVAGLPRAFVLNGTDLFGVLVARGTPTYVATTDIVVTLTIQQD